MTASPRFNHPRFLFIDTPYNMASRHTRPRLYLPLGALYLGTALKGAGVVPILYDPKCSMRLNRNDAAWFHGDGYDAIAAAIRQSKPDIVCVTNPFSKDRDNALRISRIVKSIFPEAVTVVGGVHATLFPEDYLSEPAVDIAAMGEGEETIVDLLRWMEGRLSLADIQGIAWRKESGEIVKNPVRSHGVHMDGIDFPDYGLIDVEPYFRAWAAGASPRPLSIGQRCLPVITSRGCPFECTFCSARDINGSRFRPASAVSVIEHIRNLIGRYDIDAVLFEDDNIAMDRGRFQKIVNGLAELPRRIGWAAPNGIRADTVLDLDLLTSMRKSGCRYLIVGVESGSQDVLDHIVRKSLDLRHVTELARMCRAIQLPLFAFFLLGFPGETRNQIRETIRFARGLSARYGVFPFVNFVIPLPGTKVHEMCLENDWLVKEIDGQSLVETMSMQGRGKIRTPEFTPEEISRRMKLLNFQAMGLQALHALIRPAYGRRLFRLVSGNIRAVRQQFRM